MACSHGLNPKIYGLNPDNYGLNLEFTLAKHEKKNVKPEIQLLTSIFNYLITCELGNKSTL